MREPWAWMGWIVVAGAWSWPLWQPAPMLLMLGVAHLCVLAWIGAAARTAWPALATAAFLLGAAAPASLPPAETRDHIRGTVVSASTRRAIVQADAGQAELWFSDEAPKTGTRIAAWTRASSPWVRLPGAQDSAPGLLRAHRTQKKVREWVAISQTDESAERERGPEWFGQAEHGALLWALTSGERGGLPEDLVDLLRRTGTAHLLAISGMHIGLVSGAAWAVGWWLSRPLAALRWPGPARAAPALAAVWAAWQYAALVGWPISARRAAAMVIAIAAARLLGRQPKLWSLLGLAAGGLVLADPAQVGEAGFWMSFGAVAGILWWAPAATRWLPPDHPRWLGWIVGGLGASLGATLGTLPATAWLFQQLSPLTLITNLVAGPLMAGVAVPAALAAGALPGDLGLLALATADAAAGLTVDALRALDVEPFAPAVGPLGALALALVLPLRRKPGAAAGLALLALGLREVPTRLSVTFLAIGQGDAALVEWPDGKRWLIDGGPPSDRLLHYLRRRGIRELDAIILSHPHPDHMGGLLPVVEALEVGELWISRTPEEDEVSYLALWEAAEARGVERLLPKDAERLQRATLLHPLDGWEATKKRRRVNEESLVIRIDHGEHSFLFTGDIEVEGEAALVGRMEPVDVVKVAHHGSTSSSSEAMVAAAQAEWAVVSCGVDNAFRHPRPLTLHRWRGVTLLRTDVDGTVRFETDGDTMEVSRGLR
ncbi:MAG: competence protein ComEC [Myxococcota bacterium]